jgi:stage II sporulation protein AB (anti-sigma F factor)
VGTAWVTVEFRLPAVPASVPEARRLVGEQVRELGASEQRVDDVRIAVTEAVANVVRHAYWPGQGEVEVEVDADGNGRVVVAVRDRGCGIGAARPETAGAGLGLPLIEALSASFESSDRAPGTAVVMEFPIA